MTDIGVEVGQKMRSAIKAKLMELECYVDDELPDYIMVMVANKRTKSQMNEDLQLFLGSKTSTFVEWLHIVLKKLKEVHVTNPNVFKKSTKRKIEDPELEKHVKKEKKDSKNKKLKKLDINIKEESVKSLTDDLPMNIKLPEIRKVTIQDTTSSLNDGDGFDIPTITEVNSSTETELRILEKQIKSAKSRLGVVVHSESEDDFLNLKAEPDDLFPNEQSINKREKLKEQLRKVNVIDESLTPPMPQKNVENSEEVSPHKIKEHSRIVFDLDNNIPRKKSALERLGKRRISDDIDFRSGLKKSKISLSEIRREEEKLLGVKRHEKIDRKRLFKGDKDESEERVERIERGTRESALSRLGVMSKVAVPKKSITNEVVEEEVSPNKEVPSVVKVKPRVIPPNAPQANKNLLLKAVADAQRSIAQTPSIGTNSKPDALFTKKYKEKLAEKHSKRKSSPIKQKSKLQDIISHISKNVEPTNKQQGDSSEVEYVPKPLKRSESLTAQLQYIPSPKELKSDSDKKIQSPNFIVTLDGIDKTKYESTKSKFEFDGNDVEVDKNKVESEKNDVQKKRRTPSPIIFDKVTSPVKKSINVPDVLPKIHTSPLVKNKERCKYWPGCRQGEKCEFVHPSTACKAFPQCKFGDKCLYVHPNCKFESSCTRRDCPYNHSALNKSTVSRTPVQIQVQTCKFYPNCTNVHCTFFHPRPCKFGKFCKNQSECGFVHPRNTNLTWRSHLQV
nr:zinc finger CCCH domain-containing protein 14 [Onthophagus taurus]